MTQRMERVQRLARQVLADAIGELKDPRIGFATVAAVRITPDLRHARVFVSVLGTEQEQEDTIAGLTSARSHLRGELGRQMRMKYLPELSFELDRTPEDAQRLETLLRDLHRREDGS